MSEHLINGEFQSDKYPSCPRGKVPLSVKDPTAQDLLWEYAQRRRSVDAEFAEDLEAALQAALQAAGFVPGAIVRAASEEDAEVLREWQRARSDPNVRRVWEMEGGAPRYRALIAATIEAPDQPAAVASVGFVEAAAAWLGELRPRSITDGEVAMTQAAHDVLIALVLAQLLPWEPIRSVLRVVDHIVKHGTGGYSVMGKLHDAWYALLPEVRAALDE